MAKLIFSDDTTKIVDYNQAATIYQILLGSKEPENEKQAIYVSQVKEVIFDEPKVSNGTR